MMMMTNNKKNLIITTAKENIIEGTRREGILTRTEKRKAKMMSLALTISTLKRLDR